MTKKQKFGGDWTIKKLSIFEKYLNAYITALKNQPFKKIYIDAFAGTGEITLRNGETLIGSAKRALLSREKFDHYYFIDKDRNYAKQLKELVKNDFNSLGDRIDIYCGEVNEEIPKIISSINWVKTRGLLFLDPCATQLDWITLKKIADTKAFDVWYLFPYSALNRMLPNNGNFEIFGKKIDRLLGTKEWREAFYRENPQLSIFDFEPSDNEREQVKNVNRDSIIKYIKTRLNTIFPCVSDCPKIFENSKNSAIFVFYFAVANESKSAQNLAMKISENVLLANG